MRQALIVIVIILTGLWAFSQETSRTVYFIKKSNRENSNIKKDVKMKYSSLSLKEKQKVRDKFPPINQFFTYYEQEIVNGKKIQYEKTILVTEEFYKKQSIVKTITASFEDRKRFSVKLDPITGRLHLNPKSDYNKFKNTEKEKEVLMYIPLKNQDYIWLPFWELTFTSLTVPLKYRFKDKSRLLQDDFTSAINLNFFLGPTYGNTKFIRRVKTGDKMNTWKLSVGIIVGTSTVKLNANNTTLAAIPLTPSESLNKGLFSFGFGATYAFNSFNLGVFYGWDYSIGDDADKWNYNKEPWLGVGIGYSLFKI